MTAIEQIPGVGPWLPYITALCMTAAAIATLLPAPLSTSSKAYSFLYGLVQWLALNKGQATNLTAPENSGSVAGPRALSSPRVVVTSAPKDPSQ